LWDGSAGADARFVRGVLGGLYLAWAVQAFVVQRGFQYVHVPETFLMLTLWAAHRWVWVPFVLLWLLVTSGVWIVADYNPDLKARLDRVPQLTREEYLPRHPLTDPARLSLWPACFRTDLTDTERFVLWDKLRLHPLHEASIGWEEIAEVAEFLRPRGIGPGDTTRRVIAWFDSPHAVYLMMDLDPGLPYMHVFTVVNISIGADGTGETGWQITRDATRANLAAHPPGTEVYVISDLEWTTLGVTDPVLLAAMRGPPRGEQHGPKHLLPVVTPYPDKFPYNQPGLFRTRNGNGRYIVHRIATTCDDPK